MGDTIVVETPVSTVLTIGTVGPQGPAGDFVVNFRLVTAPETLTAKGKIAASTSAGPLTLTLPANPRNGDVIDFYDYAATFDTNPLTLARNGHRIEGEEENLICNVEGAYFSLVYSGADRGWQVLPSFGSAGAVTSVNGATGAVTLTQNDIPEASQTFIVTSTNPASPTSVDVEGAFMEPDGTVDCSIVLNNTTGIVYANIILPQLVTGLRGRVVVHGTTSGSGDITYIRTEVGGSVAFPSSGYYEHPLAWRLVFEWNGQEWTVHPFFGTSPITFPPYSGTLAVFVPTPPATKTSNGQTGQIAYLNPHFYICVAPNTWRRATVAAW